MMQARIGMMQGRLVGQGIKPRQAFPWNRWQDEFAIARRVGFDAIEWLFEAADYEQNPLWTDQGQAAIRTQSREQEVAVESVCAHYFVQQPPTNDLAGAHRVLSGLIERCGRLGVKTIVVPCLEKASLKTATVRRQTRLMISSVIRVAEVQGVTLALESDLPAGELLSWIEEFLSLTVQVCYDTGNATAEGYDVLAEIHQLLPRLAEVHIKDRVRGGGSRPLGQGDAPLIPALRMLAASNFVGRLVLETPGFSDAEELATQQLVFVKRALEAPVLTG
jgi:L-ribulose-5-phosphate 3-epimerase